MSTKPRAIDVIFANIMKIVTTPRPVYELVDPDKENERIAAAEAKRERKRRRVA